MSWWIMPTHRLLPAVFVSQGLAAVARVQKTESGSGGGGAQVGGEEEQRTDGNNARQSRPAWAMRILLI